MDSPSPSSTLQCTQQSSVVSASESSASESDVDIDRFNHHEFDEDEDDDAEMPLAQEETQAPQGEEATGAPQGEEASRAAATAVQATQQRPVLLFRPKKNAGRKLSKIWVNFSRVKTVGDAHATGTCKKCGEEIRNAKPGENLRAHIEACTEIDEPTKHAILWSARSKQRAARKTQGPHETQGPALMTQDEFTMTIAKIFFVYALSFRLVEAPLITALFARILPMLKLPTRHELSGPLLTKVNGECRVQVLELIRARQIVSVVTDSWTDTNGSSITNFMVVSPGMPSLFWSSLPSKTERHTKEYIQEQLNKVMAEIREQTGARVSGVLTDNAPNMIAAGKAIEAAHATFSGGCAAHAINLLIHDICKIDIVKKAKDFSHSVTRFVRDRHGLLETFRDGQNDPRYNDVRKRGLVLPVPTRWYSYHACMKNVLGDESLLRTMFQDSALMKRFKDTKLPVLQIAMAKETTWNNLKQVVNMLEPIIDALRELESDNCKTSNVYKRFRDLLRHDVFGKIASRRTDIQKSFLQAIQKRWDFIHTNAMGIAFLLDPSTDQDDFVATDLEDTMGQACDFVERTGILEQLEVTKQEFYSELVRFTSAKEDSNWKELASATAPREWWKALGQRAFPLLGLLAQLVFAIPASSAARERAWSIMDLIHTNRRNRLSIPKCNQLTYIYINYGSILKQPNLVHYELHPESIDDDEDVADQPREQVVRL